MAKTKRTKSELWEALSDQVDLLVYMCGAYDSGKKNIASHIATTIRVLVHQTRHSHALLQLLGLRDKRFLDTANEIEKGNLLSDSPLIVISSGGGVDYLPICSAGGGPVKPRWIPFSRWWNQNVVKDHRKQWFTRRDLVLNLANTDGGAHVDPELDAAYAELSRDNSLGWYSGLDGPDKSLPSPAEPCVRQIGHEVIETLRRKVGERISIDYSPAQIKRASNYHGIRVTVDGGKPQRGGG